MRSNGRARPLLALNGHASRSGECLLSGVKRTLVLVLGMSAYDPERKQARTRGSAIGKRRRPEKRPSPYLQVPVP